MQRLYSTIECARLLGVAEHRLNYAHRIGRLPAPKQTIAGKRIYTPNDIARAAAYFRVAPPEQITNLGELDNE